MMMMIELHLWFHLLTIYLHIAFLFINTESMMRIRSRCSTIIKHDSIKSSLFSSQMSSSSSSLSSPTQQQQSTTPSSRVSNRISNPQSGVYDFNQWSKAFKSQLNEYDYIIEAHDIEGEIPATLKGTLFRNMPARFERGDKPYGHYLDGDGYLIKLTIDNNYSDDCNDVDVDDDDDDDGGMKHTRTSHLIRFQSKFIQTDEYKEEQLKQQVKYRSTFRTQRELFPILNNNICLNNMFDLKLKNLANTNCIYWGGRLLTLFEASVPYRIDPYTLDTIGEDDMEVPSLRPGITVLVPSLRDFNAALHDRLFGSAMTAHPKVDKLRDSLIGTIFHAIQ